MYLSLGTDNQECSYYPGVGQSMYFMDSHTAESYFEDCSDAFWGYQELFFGLNFEGLSAD